MNTIYQKLEFIFENSGIEFESEEEGIYMLTIPEINIFEADDLNDEEAGVMPPVHCFVVHLDDDDYLIHLVTDVTFDAEKFDNTQIALFNCALNLLIRWGNLAFDAENNNLFANITNFATNKSLDSTLITGAIGTLFTIRLMSEIGLNALRDEVVKTPAEAVEYVQKYLESTYDGTFPDLSQN